MDAMMWCIEKNIQFYWPVL